MKSLLRPSVISRSSFLRTVALGLSCWPAAVLAAQQSPPGTTASENKIDLGNLRTFVELARSDLRTQKALVLAQNIDFTPDEAVEFWPVQREFEIELNKLLDHRYDLFVRFLNEYGKMNDKQATELAGKVFDLEEKRLKLRRKYFDKFRKVIPAVKAAQFFQIEHQINMAIDLQVAASMPLIK